MIAVVFRADNHDGVSAAAPRRSSVCDAYVCVCQCMCIYAPEVRYPVAISPLVLSVAALVCELEPECHRLSLSRCVRVCVRVGVRGEASCCDVSTLSDCEGIQLWQVCMRA